MLKIYLIRHGKTQGNLSGKYIGSRTDEPLCEEGIRELKGKTYPQAQILFVSPMKRCIQTAELLYPGLEQRKIPLLQECDFGDFENKNYKELSGNPDYQAWIDSGGTLPFPGGEDSEEFRSKLPREQQRGFLVDAARLLRESYMLHAGLGRIGYLWGAELAFCSKFAPYVGSENIEPLVAEIESAMAQISQNGNPTIVFTHFALSVSKMIKRM